MDEIVICSAIWYQELELKKPEVLEPRGFSPYNVDKGIVFCGWRHPNCIYQMVAITGLKNHEAGKSIQGFLTNKNRFLNREEAAELVLLTGQLKKLQYGNILYSEDLY